MNTYLITYDLVGPSRDYPRIRQAIQAEANGWCHAMESVFVIRSPKSAVDLRDHLSASIDRNDQLAVLELTGTAAWTNLPEERSAWLKKTLAPATFA